MQGDKYVIKCVCLPKMKKDTVYKATLAINDEGHIQTATCGCPAGVGPTGRCKHISALCFALEEFYRIKKLRSPRSCTSELQKWNQPRNRKLDACAVDDIKFVKYEYGKEKKVPQSLIYDPRPPTYKCTPGSSLDNLRQDLLKTGKDIALLHLLPDASSVNHVPSSSHLPPSSLAVREEILNCLQSMPQPLNFSDVAAVGLKLIETLQYTEEQERCIEVATREQSNSKRWFEERQFRVTASKFGIVVKHKRQHTFLASQLLYSSVSPSVTALQWGWQHEPDALHQYRQTLSSGLTLISAGFFADICGYLGASPDGIVEDAAGQSLKLVEMKCPFRARDKTVEQASMDDRSFCCRLVDDTPCLRPDHDYYHQVQGQMAITDVHVCDFVVWTPRGIHAPTIHFDNEFWNSTSVPKLEHFHYYFLLPEIVYPQKPSSPYDYSCHKSFMYQN